MNIARAIRTVTILWAMVAAVTLSAFAFSDPQILVTPFIKDQVIELKANRFIGTSIHFLPDEKIIMPIALGDPDAWDLSLQSDQDMVIKPIAKAPDTNMTVRTTKRFYYFYLTASANHGASKDAIMALRIYDPSQSKVVNDDHKTSVNNTKSQTINMLPEETPDAILYSPGQVTQWNHSYQFKSKNTMGLTQVIDNGLKTYFGFKPDAQLPAIFLKGVHGERLVQSLMSTDDEQHGYVVALDVAPPGGKWVLRRGKNKLTVKKGR
jgi:type IV secretory pathway VirB9-like protein